MNVKSRLVGTSMDIDATKTSISELSIYVAELLKENESLKKHCKNLNESIKETRTKTIDKQPL